MAVALNINVAKIVFTSPNMPSPSPAGLRSHVLPSETDLGTWLESGGTMTRVAYAQNIEDIPYNIGIDRPVFGLSGIVTADTSFVEDTTNNIYVQTDQTWSITPSRNAYVDDNSWLEISDIQEYDYANSPPDEAAFLENSFTSSGTVDSTRNITINGCATYADPDNYIFNTNQLYKYDTLTKQYSLTTMCPYTVNYPVTMLAVSGTLHMFYLDTENNLIKNIEYNLSTSTWDTNTNYEYHTTAATITELKAVYIDDVIKITLKYSENSVPPSLYIYSYNINLDSWGDEFIATCGYYNLNFNNSMIECDGTYLYTLERSSKLLHKVHLETKIDDQMIIRYETTNQSSTILNGNYLYTYIGTSNKFTRIDTTTETTYALSAPTLSGTDATIENESTTLSTDGTYLYLGLNKGISWDSETCLYKYNIVGDSWTALNVPSAGSVNFDGKMCRYGNNIYGSDDINLYAYDTTNNKWNILTSLPREDAFDSVIAANSTHVYIVISECGFFWRYDLSTSTWEVLQSLSLPAPLAYEGTCPGSLLIDGDTIYLGLYYNYVLATRDTFYYRYSISAETWTTYVAPKTSTNRSFYMLLYKSGSDIHLAGDIAYTGNPVDTYTYRDHKCTDLVNNTWTVHKAVVINAMENSKYVCMYGQYYLNNVIYISFTTATNLGFNCSGPTCRQINVSAGTSNYWTINPTDKHYIITDPTNTDLYCASVTNGILYKYDITTTTTTRLSIPRKAFVNYFVCSTAGSTYLLGKQEIEYDPDLYKYKFYVYKDNAGSWDEYDIRETTCTSGSLKLNTIQEYYELSGTTYMAAFLRSTENLDVSVAEHKKYDISGKDLNDFVAPTLTTSITSSGTNLYLAIGNTTKEYDIITENTTLFQEGIAGNRASSFPYLYKHSGNLRAFGNQYFTLSAGGKLLTYESVSGTWGIIDSKNTSSTFYNTLDYAERNNELYIVNTTEQMTLDMPSLDLEYVSNPPYSSMCTTTSGGIIVYNDHYACPTHIYNNHIFTEIPSDVVKTHKSSNLLCLNDTLYFSKNSVTNEVSTIQAVSGTKSIVYSDYILGETPFFSNINDDIYMLLPEYNTLSTISGTTITEIKDSLDISEHVSACSDNNDTIYFTKGKDYYLFNKINVNTCSGIQLTNLPECYTEYSAMAYYDNKIYYITSNHLYIYNTTTNTWGTYITLPQQIYSKGIIVDADYIYYCGNMCIKRLLRLQPEVEDTTYGPIPTRHYSSYALCGSDIYLYYNTQSIISECTALIGEERIMNFDLNNLAHLLPTAVPYNFNTTSDTEKNVKFTWEISSTSNITHYRVYRTTNINDAKTYIGKTSTLSFTDTLADRGITYYYFVKSCNEYGSGPTFSSAHQIIVDGHSYKYCLTATSWNNRIKNIIDLPNSDIYFWGNSNLTFTNTVKITLTFGEAYNCYLTAWDDDNHNTTSHVLLTNECYRVGAVAFASKEDGNIVEPDTKAMYCAPKFDKILKGNSSYYGKFNISYEALPERYGAYLLFKPILINIPESLLTKGIYEFKTTFHYQYT